MQNINTIMINSGAIVLMAVQKILTVNGEYVNVTLVSIKIGEDAPNQAIQNQHLTIKHHLKTVQVRRNVHRLI